MLANTFTTDALVKRIALMRIYFGTRLFSGSGEVAIREVLAGTTDEYTLRALETWMSAFDKAALAPLVVYEALDAIEEDLAGMPAVKLYVPVTFGDAEVEHFGMWFRKEVQPNMLLTLKVDTQVVGGCAFVWRDVYYDFSIRYHIDKKSDEIYSMFEHHLHAK